jgi:hypothetical protein
VRSLIQETLDGAREVDDEELQLLRHNFAVLALAKHYLSVDSGADPFRFRAGRIGSFVHDLWIVHMHAGVMPSSLREVASALAGASYRALCAEPASRGTPG